MNKKKLIKIIEDWIEETESDTIDLRYLSSEEKGILNINGVTIETQDRFGGSGKGDNYWVVLKVTEENEQTYWMVPGWYNSTEGGTLEVEDLYQVEPFEKIVRDWREL